MPFWYKGGKQFDTYCESFIPTLRDLKAGKLAAPEWDTIFGKVARLILADQFSRNAFRGEAEAFDYDTIALALARELTTVPTLNETVALPKALLTFVGVPLQHSEQLIDHDTGLYFTKLLIKKFPDFPAFMHQMSFVTEHRDVIVKFGRYPHRNARLGRESTEEENIWLNDTENLPVWAH